ncbi:MAG: hypothetical protein HPZ91_03310 [Lentisphaeria bacterium]|nr:hypothetical protein [Lentisphaeria bacterium]
MTTRSTFSAPGALAETFFAMSSVPGRNFREEAEELLARYREASAGTLPVWIRFHLSDIANQAKELRELFGRDAATVGQPPAGNARIALEAYHLSPEAEAHREGTLLELRLKHYRQLFFRTGELVSRGSGPQMREEFDEAEHTLSRFGGTVAENLQRTWIYCRDIDNNYENLVIARRELFRKYGLTEKTHYIASTGIEGSSDPYWRLVRMDSFALFGHRPEQIEYMQALDHLSPTHVYGVTFERGTRIIYGDRSHYYISGTASIDRDGAVVHPRNVAKQTERLVENVEALLTNHGGTLSDLKQAVVYLRDPADAAAVEAVLAGRLSPETARIMVKGTVCRPGWLVEMDGIAVNANGNPAFERFA